MAERTGHTHDFTRSMWGHSVGITKIAGRKIEGHGWGSTPRPGLISLGVSIPRQGDWIAIKDRDGKQYRYLLTEVRGVRDPQDMFFFKAKFDPERRK